MGRIGSAKKIFFISGILFCLIAFSFWPVLNNGFTNWDDDKHLTENILVRSVSIENVKQIFKSSVNRVYIPLTLFSFALEYHFFQYNPLIYHVTNLLLHIGVVALIILFLFNLGLSLRVATIAGCLFAIHPMHVESVAWVTERKDVLYSFFYMFSLLMYCQYVDQFKKRYYFLSIFFGFLSILSKPMALSLPLVMLLCDWIKRRKFDRGSLFDKIPHFLYIIPIAWITYSLHSRAPLIDIKEAVTIWVWTFSFYIQKFFFPLELNPLYQLPVPVEMFSLPYIFAFAAFLIVVFVCVVFRKNVWCLFSVLFYFLSIFFLLRFDQKVDMNIVADRFMYLPSLGFCVLIALGIDRFLNFSQKKNFFYRGVGVVVLFFVLLGVKTNQQIRVWKDSVSLWSYVITLEPKIATAYNNRGKTYLEMGKRDKALNDFNKVIELNPFHINVYNNRGVLLSALGKNKFAVQDFTNAIELNGSFSQAYFNRGRSYLQMKDRKMAIRDFQKADSLGLVEAEFYLKNLEF